MKTVLATIACALPLLFSGGVLAQNGQMMMGYGVHVDAQAG